MFDKVCKYSCDISIVQTQKLNTNFLRLGKTTTLNTADLTITLVKNLAIQCAYLAEANYKLTIARWENPITTNISKFDIVLS